MKASVELSLPGERMLRKLMNVTKSINPRARGKQEREGTISVDAKERHSRLLSDSGCVRVFYSLVRSRNADALLSQARNHRLALTKSRTPRGSWHAEPTGGVLYPLQLFPTPLTSRFTSPRKSIPVRVRYIMQPAILNISPR